MGDSNKDRAVYMDERYQDIIPDKVSISANGDQVNVYGHTIDDQPVWIMIATRPADQVPTPLRRRKRSRDARGVASRGRVK